MSDSGTVTSEALRRCCVIAFCLLLAGTGVGLASAQQDENAEVHDSGVAEKVKVVLVEFKLLVTDKQGRPITDLRPDEVQVLEGGKPQRVAAVDSWLTAGSDSDLGPEVSVPVPVYSPTGEVHEGQMVVVPPPAPVRRVFFIFDIKNSRRRVREDWRAAAVEWATNKMSPQDVASVVVMRNYPQWVLRASSDQQTVLLALHSADLFTDMPNRSRREDMTDLVNDLQTQCVDIGSGPRRDTDVDPTAIQGGGDETTCTYRILRPVIDQWGNESDETIDALRQFTGQVAAIPGRKAVMLFSEGIIPDPTDLGINAALSVWGSHVINFRSLESSLRRDAYREIDSLHRVAAASDVVYFTLDTRSAAERGGGSEIEFQVSRASNSIGVNPWNEMYDSTRGTLAALAWATGGRPFYGNEELEADVETAAASFYGVYNVSYYRSNPGRPAKLKVKVLRKGTKFRVPKSTNFRRNEARTTPVELAVGRPVMVGFGETQQLPVAVMALYDLLPFRRGAGGRGCQLGVFLQAQRPDGSVAAERLDTAIVVVSKDELEALEGQYYKFRTSLEVPPGAYRLRVRVTDDFNEIVGDTFIDLTVGQEQIVPGFIDTGMKKEVSELQETPAG